MAVLVPGLILAAMAPANAPAQDRGLRPRTAYEDLQLFSQVLNQIRVNHPDTLDSHTLFMAAIEGMIQAADPHSYVLPAARLAPEKERAFREGRLHPVPVVFRFIGGAPVVVSIHPDSRAAAVDLLPGDELIAVDARPVTATTAQELEIHLAGPHGSTVELTVQRRRLDGSIARLDRIISRESVSAPTAVPVATMLDTVTGYVRVTSFADDRVFRDLRAGLESLERQGMRALILDLRDNGGGLLDEAAAVASAFLPRRATVYITRGRKQVTIDTVRVERAFWRGNRDYPVVLLVNEGTASASELVAGALQDHDRALVVGRTTFGKALMMQPFPLTDGSVMVLVIGEVRTPCGRTVQRPYREVSTRDYYRAARDERDRAGRPFCLTPAGRTVYGGGGIYPDHVLPEINTPLWLGRLQEENVLLRWIPGLLQDDDPFPDLQRLLDDPRLPDHQLGEFLRFAREQGFDVPDDDASLDLLQRSLVTRIARTRFGAVGAYRFLAHHDPEVAAALALIPHAAALLDAR